MAFFKDGSYTPSWERSREHMLREDNGDPSWWDMAAPAYRWVMAEMKHAGMPCPNPDAAPLWAWVRWVDAHGRIRSRPDRRCWEFRGQDYDAFDLIHLRVDEHRVLLTDFDQYHSVLSKTLCAPISADEWSSEQIADWFDSHWDDSIEKKRKQWHDNVIVQPSAMPESWIQACLWSVVPEDVVDVRRSLLASHTRHKKNFYS
ncbi:MAG: hypothetical protein KH167_08765 [Bifidobacterium scardovii]|nr:hypothetical protein [Bifidobacterium scardovii]